MEGHVGPVGGEMRLQGAHPSHATVGHVSFITYVCLEGKRGTKASAAAMPVSGGMWPFTQSLMHSFIHRCLLSTYCVPGMVPGGRAKVINIINVFETIVEHLLCARNYAKH